jgi:hypothetical protein
VLVGVRIVGLLTQILHQHSVIVVIDQFGELF